MNLRPGSAEFCAVLDEIKQLHLRKTLDYGCDEDALSNIRSSSDVINVSPWAGCVLRISDKMHRLRSYFRRGRVDSDGIDTVDGVVVRTAPALCPPDDWHSQEGWIGSRQAMESWFYRAGGGLAGMLVADGG